MKYLIIWFLGLTSVFSSVIVHAADRDVSVYYYPWYDRPSNTHWKQGTIRTHLIPASPPTLGRYSSRDRGVIQRHLAWSDAYGIDNWICSWWGPDGYEDRVIRGSIAPLMSGRKTTYCIYYESQGLLSFNSRTEQIVFDDRQISKFAGHVRYLARTHFGHPNYQRFGGRPVLHLYLSRCFAGRYAEALNAARAAARQEGHDVYIVGDEIYWGTPNADRIGRYDAITTYSMHGPHDFKGYPEQSEWLKHMSIKYDEHKRLAAERGVKVIPNVMPGFNNRGSGGNLYAIPRQYGPQPNSVTTFEAVAKWSEPYIDPQLNAVCITSFNEWHEDTQIEPTVLTSETRQDDTGQRTMTSGYRYQGYGTKYLELVRQRFGKAESNRRSP